MGIPIGVHLYATNVYISSILLQRSYPGLGLTDTGILSPSNLSLSGVCPSPVHSCVLLHPTTKVFGPGGL